MALSFRTSTQNSSSTGTAISVSAPTGTTAGDLVKVVVQANGQTTIVDNNVLVSATNLTTGADLDGGTSSTTASVSPTGNKLLLLSVASRTIITVDPNEPTITGNGLTWVSIGTTVYDNTSASRRRITLFRAMGASPSAGTIAIDFGGQAQTSVIWSLNQFTNADTSGTNGSGAIVQTVTNFDPDADVSTLTVTLAAFASSNNATFGTFGSGDAETLNVGTGFSSVSEGDSGDGNIHLLTEFKNSNDTSVDMSKATNSELGGIAVEIKSANAVFTEQVNDYKPNTTNGHTMSVFSRVFQTGDPTTFNFTSGASGRWGVVAITATDSSTPEDDVAPSTTNATNRDSAGDGNATTASINTGVNNAIHIVAVGWDTGAIGAITPPTGYTLLADANGGGEPTHLSYKVIASAGATGAVVANNFEFAPYITFSFSIKSVAVASTVKTLASLGVG